MGGDAENTNQITSSDDRRLRRRRHIHFPVGSSVEVRAHEEGMEGVHFSATVILPPPPPPPPPSPPICLRKKSRKLLYVEYDNLLASEEGSERLREYVDVSSVRPPPPALQEEEETDRAFTPDDVVDAFYNDGWWTGVVSRVVEGGERVVVTFQNPPDELEFEFSDLRAHWDWVNGVWVKQKSLGFMISMFGVGRTVEISLDQGYHRDAWIPAIVHRYLGNGVLLVEYDIGKGDVMAEVDLHNVRPCPPVFVDDDQRKFVLSERVDAYFDFTWWSGMITKELEDNRYVVFFKERKQDKEFDQWNIRPYMEWKVGKWLLPSSFSDDGAGDENFSASADYNQNMSFTKRRRQCPSDSGTGPKMLKEQNVVQDGHDQPIEQEKTVSKQRSVRAKRKVVRRKIKGRLHRVDHEKGLQESVCLGERGTVQSTSGEITVHVQDSLGGKTMQFNTVDDEFDNEQPLLKWIEPEEMQPSPSVIDGSRLSPMCNVEQCMADGEKQRDSVVVDDEDSGAVYVQDSLGGKMMQVNRVDDKLDNEQPLLKWIEPEEMQPSPSIIDGLRPSPVGKVEQCMADGEKQRDGDVLDDDASGRQAAYALVDEGSIVPNELQSLLPCVQKKIGLELPSELKSLPFVKNTSTSSPWGIIESMCVFQRIPQKPHFQPLEHFKESLREGIAIGYMITFACLVEKACRLQFSDPKSIIEDITETLADMERHGFDVSHVRDRLTKLLGLKVKQEKLVDEVNNFKNHIQEHNHEKTRIEEEIREMNEKMRKLQEKLSLAESAKQKEDDEIASLQAGLKETEESIRIVECDFEGL